MMVATAQLHPAGSDQLQSRRTENDHVLNADQG
jgi:hypothetical protein